VTIPHLNGQEVLGIVDLVEMRYVTFDDATLGKEVHVGEIPHELAEEAELSRAELVEAVAEHASDEILEGYFEQGDLDAPTLRRALRAATLASTLQPVLCGAALRNKGIQVLLDAVVEYLPSPQDVESVTGTDPKTGKEIIRRLGADEPLAALAFKTFAERHGDLTYLRVYSGSLRVGDQVYNSRQNRVERVARLLQMHADSREAIDEAPAGEIAAVVGLRFTSTGDTLCKKQHPIVLESMRFADPVISLAIEPRSSADRDNLDGALAKLARDDPTFTSHVDPETGQTLISGMGELHLEVLVRRLEEEFNVPVHTGKPRVAYRQTVAVACQGEHVFERVVGEKTQYARVKVRLDPVADLRKVEYLSFAAGVPRGYADSVKSGVLSQCAGGVGYGYPVVQLRATVLEGETREGEGTEGAFEAAASLAFREAFESVDCVVLEPIMRFEVQTPEAYLGDVLADLNRRRAEIDGVEHAFGSQSIRGTVPISEMFGYSTGLRSLSQGRASYSMEPHSYAPVPPDRAKDFIL
jgi:elongation factor G